VTAGPQRRVEGRPSLDRVNLGGGHVDQLRGLAVALRHGTDRVRLVVPVSKLIELQGAHQRGVQLAGEHLPAAEHAILRAQLRKKSNRNEAVSSGTSTPGTPTVVPLIAMAAPDPSLTRRSIAHSAARLATDVSSAVDNRPCAASTSAVARRIHVTGGRSDPAVPT
jgi:hypothetical protein